MLLPQVGEGGQRRLSEATVLVVGCGALGSAIADILARAGVGTMRLVDRDSVELTNLQRQQLFDENDVAHGTPKAEAARARIGAINSEIAVEAHVDDFNHRNAERLADGVDLLVDGLDNFETRYLLNDLAVARHLPYVYGGAVATTGLSTIILPAALPGKPARDDALVHWSPAQSTPCLRCLFPEPPPAGTTPTCDTAGVLGPVVLSIAAHQAVQAIKLLVGDIDAVDRSLLSIDVWANRSRRFEVQSARREDCPCCAHGELAYLDGRLAGAATSLCGRGAVQVLAAGEEDQRQMDLEMMAQRLSPHGDFRHNQFLLRGTFDAEKTSDGRPVELTLFANGRAILAGIDEPEHARALYAKYIGT
jgi:adenylyltransferase/sulfurtransferase